MAIESSLETRANSGTVKKWFQKRLSSPTRKQRVQADGRFLNPQSIFHHCLLLDHRNRGNSDTGAHAGGSVSPHQYSCGGGGDVLFGHAAAADRSEHHESL